MVIFATGTLVDLDAVGIKQEELGEVSVSVAMQLEVSGAHMVCR